MVKPLLIKYKQDFDEKLQICSEGKWTKKTANMMNSVMVKKKTEEVEI